jgi:Reverse transcriptase (RNA-dependent DNA polymerase)
LYACNGVSCLPAPGECFLITITNFGDTVACMMPGTTVDVATNIEQVFLLGDDVDEKRDWRKEVPMDEVPESIREQALAMLSNHASMWDGRVGQIDYVSHRVKTTGGPIFQQPYRAGQFARTAEQTEVNRMLAEEIIEPTTSEWSSPVVLVPKRDGGMRLCVDYRKLNNPTERDVYPLSRLDERIDNLGDSVVISTLDANSGYWQVSMHPDDRDKTTFTFHVGTFHFKRIPFGLRSAPSTFQRAMDVILFGVRWKKCLCYLDDIIFFSSSIEIHVEDLHKVLSPLRDARVSLRLDKCHLFCRRVNYLERVIEPGKLSVQATKFDTILKAKLPHTKTELRAFLGICNVYRRFMPKFATISAPLTRHLRRDSPDSFNLEESPDAVAAFEQLRSMLTSRPVRHSRCQNKVLSISWIPMLRKVRYLLASSSVMNMVF